MMLEAVHEFHALRGCFINHMLPSAGFYEATVADKIEVWNNRGVQLSGRITGPHSPG